MRKIVLALLIGPFAAAPLRAEAPKVVTDFAPVTALVAKVMGDLGQPEQMLEQGVDPHDFALRPSQMSSLAAADLVVWIGPELTPGLKDALEDGAGRQLALLRAEGTRLQEFGTTGGHDHGSEDQGHETHSGVEEGHNIDPHAWLDPQNAIHWLGLIAAELASIDPVHADEYFANAASGTEVLTHLETEITAQLHPLAGRSFVTFHDAFGYFSGHFGLANASSLAMGDAATPGAARVAALRDQITDTEITCVFPEAGHDPALLSQIIDGTNARLGAPLDPEGLTLDPSPDAYEAVMRGLAANLADCLAP